MTMARLASVAPRIGLLLAAVSLAACSVLPTSGPSSREIKAGAAVGIRVIDVDDTVTRQLQERRSQLLFAEGFPGAPASEQIVQPDEGLDISAWEAPRTRRFSCGCGP